MREIKLKRDLLNNVRAGIKTATTRKGIKDFSVGPARLVDHADPANFVDVTIHRINLHTWGYIQEHDTLYHYEGYSNPKELNDALLDIYGEMDDDQDMTVIFFGKEVENGN